jgi:small subunit ribosomal protein S2
MPEQSATTAVKLTVPMPDIKEFLKAGVQFGHETTKWNPKMEPYIFGAKNNIHIIDLQQSMPMLAKAAAFLQEAAKRGPILFIATKRQARDIVKKYAIESGSYYVTYRWLGGLLTNFKMVKKSLVKFNQIEEEFEKGITNRTKFEVNQMKKLWERMNRIYQGVKTMDRYPEAVVIIDCHYEKGAVEEAKALNIPVVAMVDTNCDPDQIDYVIPANDDAIKSITLVMEVLADAIKKGNDNKGVKHVFKDFSNYEVQIIKEVSKEEKIEVETEFAPQSQAVKTVSQPAPSKTRKSESKGILELVKEQAEQKIEPEPVVKKTPAVKEKVTKPVKAVKKVVAVKPVKAKKKPAKKK